MLKCSLVEVWGSHPLAGEEGMELFPYRHSSRVVGVWANQARTGLGLLKTWKPHSGGHPVYIIGCVCRQLVTQGIPRGSILFHHSRELLSEAIYSSTLNRY